MMILFKIAYYAVLIIIIYTSNLLLATTITLEFIISEILLFFDKINLFLSFLVAILMSGLIYFIEYKTRNKYKILFIYYSAVASIIGINIFLNVINRFKVGLAIELSFFLFIYLVIIKRSYSLLYVIFDTFLLSTIIINFVGRFIFDFKAEDFNENKKEIQQYYLNSNRAQNTIINYKVNTKTFLFISRLHSVDVVLIAISFISALIKEYMFREIKNRNYEDYDNNEPYNKAILQL